MVGQSRLLELRGTDRTPADLIIQTGKTVLFRYASERPKRYSVPLLIITPLLVRPYILDLSPGLSFVDYLTRQGFDVFLVDFGSPDRADLSRQFEDYLGDINVVLKHMLAASNSPSVTLLGYCLGGLFAVLYGASRPEKIKNLVTVATPFDFSNAGPLYNWLQGLDVDRVVEAFGNIPGDWIRDRVRLFASTTQPGRNIKIWLDLLVHLWDRDYFERHRLLQDWLGDLRAFPGEAYRQFIKELVQGNKLVKGQLCIGGKPIDPSRITCPLLILNHTEDLLAPPDSAKPLLGLSASQDREFFEVSGGSIGHVDIIVGKEGPKVTWPKVSLWLGRRSGDNPARVVHSSDGPP